MAKTNDLEERFRKVYAVLPEPEKDRVISVFGGRALTWREVSNMLNYSREALLQMDRVKVI
jgi:hypothetical protein